MRPTHLRLALAGGLAISLLTSGVATATEVFNDRVRISMDGVVVDGCDEPVTLYGTIKDQIHITITPDNDFIGVVVTGPIGMYGIGQVSGDRYAANGVTIQAQRQDSIPGEELVGDLTGTLVDRTRLVGTGGHDTFDFHLLFHLTKVDGEPVVIWERVSVTCR